MEQGRLEVLGGVVTESSAVSPLAPDIVVKFLREFFKLRTTLSINKLQRVGTRLGYETTGEVGFTESSGDSASPLEYDVQLGPLFIFMMNDHISIIRCGSSVRPLITQNGCF